MIFGATCFVSYRVSFTPFQNCLAKALYDNHAESPEELEFKKGDVLTVLEQNPNGLQGIYGFMATLTREMAVQCVAVSSPPFSGLTSF